ncbi:MAG: hypothetical protein PVJ27_02940 [Candidatus Brocadiaceae bacterium]|jgi:hypothetical protein
MASDSEDTDRTPTEDAPAGSLVPVYGSTDIVPGIQAFRRGGMVLYTVRGEPELVRQLLGRLGEDGVEEVVAFISHRQEERESEEEGPGEAAEDE